MPGVPCKPGLWCSQPHGCLCWHCRHGSGAGGAAAEHTAAPLCHGGTTTPHSPVSKEQTFQRKVLFHQFHTHFKADFNHFCTTACFLPLLCRSCFYQVQGRPLHWTQRGCFTTLTTTTTSLTAKCCVPALCLILCLCLA